MNKSSFHQPRGLMVDAKTTKWYQACLDFNAGKMSAREEGDEDLFENKFSSHQPKLLMVDTKIISKRGQDLVPRGWYLPVNRSSSHQPRMLMVDTKIISYADKTFPVRLVPTRKQVLIPLA